MTKRSQGALTSRRLLVRRVGKSRVILVTGHAPERDTSPCPYDSGAPYFVKRNGERQLVAVEAGGPECPHTLEDSASRVDTVASWIDQVTR